MHDARLRPYTIPKDRNKIEEELRSQITTHCIRDWQKLKVHKLKKVKK